MAIRRTGEHLPLAQQLKQQTTPNVQPVVNQQVVNPNVQKATATLQPTTPVQQATATLQPIDPQSINQPVKPATFRDYATERGFEIDWNQQQGALINKAPIDLAGAGLNIQDGHYMGTTQQYDQILKGLGYTGQQPTPQLPRQEVPATQLPGQQTFREAMEQQGFNVGWNPETREILVNNTPINPEAYGLVLSPEGRHVGTPEQYQAIINQFKQPMTFDDPYKQQQQTVLDQMNKFQQYQTPEATQQYIDDLRKQSQEQFEYDPETDRSLKIAQEEAGRRIREEAGKRGMLYSDRTASQMAQEFGKLVPQYEQQAYQRAKETWNKQLEMSKVMMDWDKMQYDRNIDSFELLQSKGDYINNLSESEFQQFKWLRQEINDSKLTALEEQKIQAEEQKNIIEQAYKKMDALGYVDNEASQLLGIPVGTEVGWAKEMAIRQMHNLETMDEKLKNDISFLGEQTQAEEGLIGVREGYNIQKMGIAQQYDIEKMGVGQQYDLQKLAQQHGYDLEKMSVGQIYDLQKLAQQQSMAGGVGVTNTNMINYASSMVGTPYKWGGNTPGKGIDCSGFTKNVYENTTGIKIPRVANDQMKNAKTVSKSHMKPGDLVFFNTNSDPKTADHVGIYIGNGKMIHASSSKGVTTDDLNKKYWQSRFLKAGRY